MALSRSQRRAIAKAKLVRQMDKANSDIMRERIASRRAIVEANLSRAAYAPRSPRGTGNRGIYQGVGMNPCAKGGWKYSKGVAELKGE